MQVKNLVREGVPYSEALATAGTVATGLVGAGTTQADALALTEDFSVFATVAVGSGARLPAQSDRQDSYEVANLGANALLVYPPVGGTINALAANAGFSVPAGKVASIKKVNGTLYIASVSA